MNDFSKIYSYSKLELFDKCKQKYYFNYLDPEIAPIKKQFLKPRDYKTKGSAVHGAITLFYHLDPGKRTFNNLKKCLEKAWFSETEPNKKPPLGETGGFKDLKHERKVYLESLGLLHNFFEMDENPDLFFVPVKTIKDSFEDYEKMIKPLNNRFISGKFDRIDKFDNKLRVVDFKTGKSKNGFFQLEFYKLLTELNFNKKVNQVSYYYLNDKKIQNFDVSKTDNEKIKNKILKKIKNIEKTKRFSPNPGRFCNHCDFQEICSVFK